MEGLESFAALLHVSSLDEASKPNVQYTADGRRFISALPGRVLAGTPNRK
jgi:hypothetical protein